MKTILVLLNGIQLPYRVIEYAIEWAEKNSGNIYVLFLQSEKETSNNYAFPNDLRLAETETDKANAKRDDEEILSTNRQLIEEMAEAKNIPYQFKTIVNAKLNDVLEVSKNVSIIVVDEDFDDVGLPLSNKNISLKQIMHHANCPVQVVPANKS